MKRLLPLLCVLLIGCKDARTLSPDQLAARLQDHAKFTNVQLQPAGENKFTGTADDASGNKYSVSIEVSRDTINWKATGEKQTLIKERLEKKLPRHLGADDLVLTEKEPNVYHGKGTKQNGENIEFTVRVDLAADKATIDVPDKDGNVRQVIAIIKEGPILRTGSFGAWVHPK